MARYFFNLKDGAGGYADQDGVDLPDDDAARDYASVVAAELMKNREIKARHWRIEVQDAEGQRLFEIAFISEDRTLRHLEASTKRAMEELSKRRCALSEGIHASRTVQRQAKAVVAKSRGKPYLAADSGEAILGSL